jgi:hypothetical protein
MSTADEKLDSELHGVALLAAQDPALRGCDPTDATG